jgi:hypothetical protein
VAPGAQGEEAPPARREDSDAGQARGIEWRRR